MLKQIIILMKNEDEAADSFKREAKSRGIEVLEGEQSQELNMEECLFVTNLTLTGESLLQKKAAVLLCLDETNRQLDTGVFPYAIEGLKEMDIDYLDKIYRRFHGIPWEIVKTDRCILREMEESDLDALYKLYQDKEICRYIEDLYEDREEEREYLCKYIAHAYPFWGFGTWIAVTREDKQVIGQVGFNLREGYDDPELGFVIGLPWQRQGLGYELCTAALRAGREEYGFSSVQALVQEENLPSVRLCEKLGFFCHEKVKLGEEEYLLYKIQYKDPGENE